MLFRQFRNYFKKDPILRRVSKEPLNKEGYTKIIKCIVTSTKDIHLDNIADWLEYVNLPDKDKWQLFGFTQFMKCVLKYNKTQENNLKK
jgi:hypothetical protein